jgi:hypothetical protein
MTSSNCALEKEQNMTDDYARHLEIPEDYLWIRRSNGPTYAIPGDRLRELYYGAAAPEDTTEELLVNNREWLRVYVKHALEEWPITIPEAGPLPGWDEGWLRAVGETDEPLPEEEAAALRRLTDPALAWEIDDGETPAIGPAWLFKPR